LQVLGDTLRYLGVVLIVGIVLATVFTAWTPASFIAPDVAQEIANAVQVNSASTPTVGPPTPTTPAPRIGLVAGHKGNDSGAACPDGLTEAAVNLDLATRVKAGLETNGFIVDLLDEFDKRLEGYEALAVVSIHNDSCEYINEQATGFKVAGALDTGAQDKALRLVACLTDRYATRTNLTFHANSVTPDMTRYHSFYEVNANTPIAIIETGFLNLDRKILTEEPYRVAQGVIDGILCYALNQPVGAPTPSPIP
jgi:N-acetylmuramoyl-L-alanine amidase